MAAPFKNTNAAKDPAEVKDSFLRIYCKTTDKSSWGNAAAAAVLQAPPARGTKQSKLAAWAIQTLNEAAARLMSSKK